MAIINVRVDDELHEALRLLADQQGESLSVVIREALLATVSPVALDVNTAKKPGDEPAPESLSFIERKMLSMLHRISGALEGDDDDRTHHIISARVLESGFVGEYWREAAGFSTELSSRDSRQVVEILDMFRILAFSLRHLEEQGVGTTADLHRALKFRGFDHNDPLEGQMASYVRLLMEDERWPELLPDVQASDNGNSHMPILNVYTRMLAAFRPIWAPRLRDYGRDSYLLTVAELEQIAAARIHPSHR